MRFKREQIPFTFVQMMMVSPVIVQECPFMDKFNLLDVTNILVVVVRFFGGTKLGVGGLISAYRNRCTNGT
jgi:putative IMPACT (imprinted ancient) family translation regulator